MTVKFRYRAGLAKVFDPERNGAVADDAAEPGQRRRVASMTVISVHSAAIAQAAARLGSAVTFARVTCSIAPPCQPALSRSADVTASSPRPGVPRREACRPRWLQARQALIGDHISHSGPGLPQPIGAIDKLLREGCRRRGAMAVPAGFVDRRR